MTPTEEGPARSLYGTGSLSSLGNTSRGGSGRYGRSGMYGQSNSAASHPPRPPMRLTCVIDVSHSMAEPFGPETETIGDHSLTPSTNDDEDDDVDVSVSTPDGHGNDDNGVSGNDDDDDDDGENSSSRNRRAAEDRERRKKKNGFGKRTAAGRTTAVAKKLSKLDRVKTFAELLVKTIGHDDQLAIVTFGTTSRVVCPMKRMTDDAKVLTEHAARLPRELILCVHIYYTWDEGSK